MEIGDQLLRSLLDKIISEYEELYQDLAEHPGDPVAMALRTDVEQKLSHMERMSASGYLEARVPHDATGSKLRENVRQMKLDLRFLQRKWRRHLVSENRLRKRREKRQYVPTVAA